MGVDATVLGGSVIVRTSSESLLSEATLHDPRLFSKLFNYAKSPLSPYVLGKIRTLFISLVSPTFHLALNEDGTQRRLGTVEEFRKRRDESFAKRRTKKGDIQEVNVLPTMTESLEPVTSTPKVEGGYFVR